MMVNEPTHFCVHEVLALNKPAGFFTLLLLTRYSAVWCNPPRWHGNLRVSNDSGRIVGCTFQVSKMPFTKCIEWWH
jgi:hypothetical protein